MIDILRGVVECLLECFADGFVASDKDSVNHVDLFASLREMGPTPVYNVVDFRYDGRCFLLYVDIDMQLVVEEHDLMLGEPSAGRTVISYESFDLADPRGIERIVDWMTKRGRNRWTYSIAAD